MTIRPTGRLLGVVLFVVVWGPTSIGAQSVAAPAIEDLVRDLQAKYESVRDFSANFEHRYSGGVLSTSVVESGTVIVKKPGKMLWRYTSDEEKLYVSDGEVFYSYYPLDRQAIVADIPPDDEASTPALFLAGKGNLVEDFTAAYASEAAAAGSWSIVLTPDIAGADYESLTLTVDQQTLAITGLATEDVQGGRSVYLFNNLVENAGVADSTFDFEIPEGADVMRQDSIGR